MGNGTKPKVAFFDFSCCEGCQLQIANLENELLDVLAHIDIVAFREIMTEASDDYAIAFVEGSIVTQHDVERIKKIRENAAVLVAFGACATIGGINKIRNFWDADNVRQEVYGDKWETKEILPQVMAIDEVVPVDLKIHGCPIDRTEFLRIVQAVLMGKTPEIPDYPVCVECRANENVCMFEKGEVCLGPVTRAGCNSRCPNSGSRCLGCRGLVDNPNDSSEKDLLAKHGYGINDALRFFRMFQGYSEVAK